MKRYQSHYFIVVLIFQFAIGVSCGKKKTPHTDIPIQDSVNTGLTDESTVYYVWVDKLRARKKPGMDGEILTELSHGEKLIYLDEKSTFTDKTILRGKEYEDYWMKVKLPDGHVGWVFGAAITQDMELLSSSDDYIIRPGEGVGKINMTEFDAYDELILAYGKENVEKTKIMLGEGELKDGFILFKDSSKELECTCCNQAGGIDAVIIRRPGSPWATTDGIRIGTSLDTLVKMNGKPISFLGFGWDYAGQIMDFNGGKLSPLKGRLSIVLGEPDNMEGLEDFMGDNTFSTKDKRILKRGVRIAELWVKYNSYSEN